MGIVRDTVATAQAGQPGVSSFTINLKTNAVNELCLLWMCGNDITSITGGPTGWSKIASISPFLSAWAVVASALQNTTLTVNLKPNFSVAAILETYSGIDPNNPIDATNSNAGFGSLSASVGVNTVNNNALVLAGFCGEDFQTITPGAGFSQVTTPIIGQPQVLSVLEANAATPTGGTLVTANVSLSGTQGWDALAISLKPLGSYSCSPGSAPSQAKANNAIWPIGHIPGSALSGPQALAPIILPTPIPCSYTEQPYCPGTTWNRKS